MKSFVISGLSCQYGRKEVLHHVDVEIPAGAITSIIGSNGSGKTTLLKAMANMICPSSGACLFDETDIRKISRRTLRIVYENLYGALGIKGTILLLSALGISNMWIAVFGDVGVTILAVLNSLRLLRKTK